MNRNIVRTLIVAGSIATLITSGSCQKSIVRPIQAVSSSPSQATPQAPAGRLAQFSESLQELVTKVSPAVVQIEVTWFRPAEEDNRKVINESVMVREQTIGAGVIVDPEGYIMTNARRRTRQTEQQIRFACLH
jgi:serine protease Do